MRSAAAQAARERVQRLQKQLEESEAEHRAALEKKDQDHRAALERLKKSCRPEGTDPELGFAAKLRSKMQQLGRSYGIAPQRCTARERSCRS